MSWQVLILMQSALVAVSTIIIRILARDKKTAKASLVINALVYLFLYASILLLVPWLGHVNIHSATKYWYRYIFGGLFFALTNVFTYKTLVFFDAAIASIAGTVNSLFTIIGATIVLHENLSRLQLVGSLILLVAISYGILATQSIHKKINRYNAAFGVMYALLAGISFSIAAVNEKSLLSHMTIGTYGILGIGGQFLMSVLVALIIQPRKIPLLFSRRVFGWSALSGVFRGIGGVCFMLAEVRSNNVGLVTAISNFKIIIVIFLGWWLLKEHKFLVRKLTSATIAIIGLMIMFGA
jgi:drug/metabolite transporter (DMT)-like permease